MRRQSSHTFVGMALLCLTVPMGSPLQAAPEPLPPDPMIQSLVSMVSADTLESHVLTMVDFFTRNTVSDTTSPTQGIGAARQMGFQVA